MEDQKRQKEQEEQWRKDHPIDPMEYNDKDDYVNPFTDDFGNFEKDVDEDIEKLEQDSYDFVDRSLPEGWLRESWERLHKVRWIINAVTVGVPFSSYVCIAISFNIGLNIDFNNWWAQGNFFLMS